MKQLSVGQQARPTLCLISSSDGGNYIKAKWSYQLRDINDDTKLFTDAVVDILYKKVSD